MQTAKWHHWRCNRCLIHVARAAEVWVAGKQDLSCRACRMRSAGLLVCMFTGCRCHISEVERPCTAMYGIVSGTKLHRGMIAGSHLTCT